MRLVVVCLRDNAAEAFMRPWFAQSLGLAIRSLQDEVNRADSANPIYQHPDDFDLWELGSWVDDSGEFDLLDTPRRVCTARSLKGV